MQDQPARGASIPNLNPPRPLPGAIEIRQVDEAIDYAARVCRATASEFLAAPTVGGVAGVTGIDLAVEFFVPPVDLEAFARELDRALTRRSPAYAAARRSGAAEAMRLTVIPGGTFHQWRSAWKVSPRTQHDHRWSTDRQLLQALVHQARTGWHELSATA